MRFVFFFVICLFVLIQVVSGFSVSSQYNSGRDLKIYPGDVKVVDFRLYNSVSKNAEVVKVFLSKGDDVAKILGDSLVYEVPPGGNPVNVQIEIRIPEDAKPGEGYDINILFKGISSDSGKENSVSFSPNFVNSFKVLVAGDKNNDVVNDKSKIVKKSGGNILWIFYSVLSFMIMTVLIFIIFLVRRRNVKNIEMKSPEFI